MVGEGASGVMSACADFNQNAWKKDLCVNCQRPRAEHMVSKGTTDPVDPNVSHQSTTDSPKPAKRNSLMTKSWTVLQNEDKTSDMDDDDKKWAAMCLPSTESKEEKTDKTEKLFTRREHCYEDIDGESMKQERDSSFNFVKSEKTSTKQKIEETLSKSLSLGQNSSVIQGNNKFTGNRESSPRSRSASREKSPAPALKPKPLIETSKVKMTEDANASKTKNDVSGDKGKVSPRSKKKLRKNQKSLSFVEDKPEVIGEDGGMDNLYPDTDDGQTSVDDSNEVLEFTEDEKDWALQALKNTIWNTEHVGADEDKGKDVKQSKEFEDAQVESLLQSERFANAQDCDPLPDKQNFGTFPLRNKSEKSAIESMFTSNRLSTLSETLENVGTENPDDSQSKYDSVLKFLNGGKLEFSSSPQHEKKSTGKNDLNSSDTSEPSYDDPWSDKFGLDAESEMNLLDEIKGEIDLDSSNAGFALVDLLNDVLAKYSSGIGNETDSVKSLDDDKTDKRETKDKNAEFEAKMVTLAANLRKQRAKGRAPRPPSCPPEPPQEGLKSPAKQLELRAAQSKEPMFKMVPLGKPIGGHTLSQSTPAPSAQRAETLPLSSSTPENMEGYKIKGEKDKQKKGGGIGSFFSRILRRGKDSETDLLASSETLVSQTGSDVQSDSDNQSDKGNNSDKKSEKSDSVKPERRSSKSSPQMKLKVLPGKPASPKQTNRVTALEKKDGIEKDGDPKSSQKLQTKTSPASEHKSKDNSSEISSPNIPKGKEEGLRVQLSPNKGADKDTLAVSPKSKEAPPLPLHPPRETTDPVPKPRARGNSDGGAPRSRPRTRDMTDAKPRDTPNVPPPKPPVAAKPRPPSVQTKSLDLLENPTKASTSKTDNLRSTISVDDEVSKATKVGADSQNKVDPKLLRKRAKSPKRFAAPAAPVRSSMPNIAADSSTSINSNIESSTTSLPAVGTSSARTDKKVPFAKELELKLSMDLQTASTEMRKTSVPAPPSPPCTKIDITDGTKSITKDKDIPKTGAKETEKSKSSSKDDLNLSPPSMEKQSSVTPETDAMSIPTSTADIPIQLEKIELPRPAGNSRKSFLGKLNRKNKPPPPPSVKRTKSITESSVAAEHHLKRIDLKDISGPVLITDMSSNKAVNRRNTITIGDDNPFLSGGSTSSGSTSAGEKCELSPRESVENLYEFIKSEAPTPPGPIADKKNFYDPVVDKTVGLRPPSMTGSEGYLEPVRSANGPVLGESVRTGMGESTTSLGAMTTSMISIGSNITSMNQSVSGDLETAAAVIEGRNDDDNISEERRELLASQPIYEEINGYGKLGNNIGEDKFAEDDDKQEIYGVNVETSVSIKNKNESSSDQKTMPLGHTGLPTLKSKDSFSSESDLSSANNSLSRPRPIPRRRPRQVGSGFEQYVAMNRPSVAVFLNEEQLREMLSKLTAMNLQTLREIYTQHEKCFTKENLQLGAVGPLKWHDFDIYGKPLHTSEKCIVYNAKLKSSMSPCQVMEAMRSNFDYRIYLTRIMADIKCDTFLHSLDENTFRKVENPGDLPTQDVQEENGIKFKFEVYEKPSPQPIRKADTEGIEPSKPMGEADTKGVVQAQSLMEEDKQFQPITFNVMAAMCGSNRGIGYRGKLPWPYLKRDHEYYTKKTSTMSGQNLDGKMIIHIQGRVSWEGCRERERNLKHVRRVLISSDRDILESHPCVLTVVPSFEAAVMYCSIPGIREKIDSVWIMGGSRVYEYGHLLNVSAVSSSMNPDETLRCAVSRLDPFTICKGTVLTLYRKKCDVCKHL